MGFLEEGLLEIRGMCGYATAGRIWQKSHTQGSHGGENSANSTQAVNDYIKFPSFPGPSQFSGAAFQGILVFRRRGGVIHSMGSFHS